MRGGKMRLTKREKTMLVILLVFGTLALFSAYALVPAMESLQYETTVLSEMQLELDAQLARVRTVETVEQELADAQTEAASLHDTLYAKRTYDTGLALSNMLAKYSLSPVQLTIGERETSPLAEKDNIQYAFYRDITICFTGERADADAFIDAISEYDVRYVLSGISINHRTAVTEYTLQLALYEFDEK